MDLPAPIAQALYSPETLAKIKSIGEKYRLHLDVVGDLEAFINLRIADKIDDAALKADIKIIVRDPKLAESIIADINNTIFIPLKQALVASTQEPKKTVEPSPSQPQKLISEPQVPALQTPRPSIVEQKLGTTPQTQLPSKPVAPQAPRQYKGTDPYHEPLD
jgi:hypothetical protein